MKITMLDEWAKKDQLRQLLPGKGIARRLRALAEIVLITLGIIFACLLVLLLAHMLATKPANADWATWPTQYMLGLFEKENAADARAYLGITDAAFSDPNIILFADLDPNAYDILYWPTTTTMSTTPITTYTKTLLQSSDAASLRDFAGIGADESVDGALTTLGERHIRGDEDRVSYHYGSGGEISGEATRSGLFHVFMTFDPGKIYDSNEIVPLPPLLTKRYPNGIIIDYWSVECSLDPDVEMSIDLCFCDNARDYNDPNIIDVLDTTSGFSEEDDDSLINDGYAIFTGKHWYLRFRSDPEGTCNLMTFNLLGHSLENK
jgi:hypothetical protein